LGSVMVWLKVIPLSVVLCNIKNCLLTVTVQWLCVSFPRFGFETTYLILANNIILTFSIKSFLSQSKIISQLMYGFILRFFINWVPIIWVNQLKYNLAKSTELSQTYFSTEIPISD
jgi:hypothetical protein